MFADPSCAAYCKDCAMMGNYVEQAKTLKDAAASLSKYFGANKHISCVNSLLNSTKSFIDATQGKYDHCDFVKAAKLAAETACTTIKCIPSADPASKSLKLACDVGKWGSKLIMCMDYNIGFMQGATNACKASLAAGNPIDKMSCPRFHSSVPVDACVNGRQRTENEIQQACATKMTGRQPKIPSEALGSCISSCVFSSNSRKLGCPGGR